MRFLAVLALAAAIGPVAVLRPSVAHASPALIGLPPAWVTGAITKLVIRVLEFVDWIEEDLSAQAERRRGYDPPPLLAPPLDAITSGGSSTVPGALRVRPPAAGSGVRR